MSEPRTTEEPLDGETERCIAGVIAAVQSVAEGRESWQSIRYAEIALRVRIRELVEEARQQEIAFRNQRERNAAIARSPVPE